MPRKRPPPSGPASTETIEGHLEIGGRWISSAAAQYPELPVEDAVAQVQRDAGSLAFRSVRRYRADLRHGLREHFGRTGRIDDFETAWSKVDAALTARKARIPPDQKRTSAKKVVDATEQEARALFYELKRHALAHGNPNAILACLFVLAAGHGGFRPIELRGATLAGTVLTLPNAKKRPGHEPKRAIDIADLDVDVQKGIGLMLSLIDHGLSKPEFAAWQKVIANQMMRACKRIGIRILSLYSFRHVAIASWAAAGLSPEEIAKLCGHISIRTAHTHYARADKGHRRRAVVRPATPEPDAAFMDEGQGPETPATSNQSSSPQQRSNLEIEDMPEPRYKAADGPIAMSREDIERWQKRGEDERDPKEIAANLRAARLAREAREAEQASRKPDFDRDEG